MPFLVLLPVLEGTTVTGDGAGVAAAAASGFGAITATTGVQHRQLAIVHASYKMHIFYTQRRTMQAHAMLQAPLLIHIFVVFFLYP